MPYLRADDHEPEYRQLWDRILNHPYLPNRSLLNRAAFKVHGLRKDSLENHIRAKCRLDSESGMAMEVREKRLIPEPALAGLSGLSLSYVGHRNRRRIVKTAHGGLSLPFIYRHFRPKVLIVFRHPANVVSSCLRMGIKDANREVFRQKRLVKDFLAPYATRIGKVVNPIELAALQIGIIYYVLEQYLRDHTDWVSVTHESLCRSPERQFRNLFEKMGLDWGPEIRKFLRAHDVPGSGYQIARKSSQEIDKWKRLLSPEQVGSVSRGYGIVPVRHYADFGER